MADKSQQELEESTILIHDKRDKVLPKEVLDLVKYCLKQGTQTGRILVSGLHGAVVWMPRVEK
jgi:hypothetical protein